MCDVYKYLYLKMCNMQNLVLIVSDFKNPCSEKYNIKKSGIFVHISIMRGKIMIYQNENSFHIVCPGNEYCLSFAYLDDHIIVELYKTYSNIRFRSMIADAIRCMKSSDHPYIGGVLLSEKEVLQLVRFLKNLECSERHIQNASQLILKNADGSRYSNQMDDCFELCIFADLSRKEMFFGGIYKCRTLVLGEKEKKILLRNIKKVVLRSREKRKD